MRIIVSLINAEDIAVETRAGWTVMEAIRDAGLPIIAQCGGGRACATCHVHVSPTFMPFLAEMEEAERVLLEESEFYDPAISRLGCQIVLHEGLKDLRICLQRDSIES